MLSFFFFFQERREEKKKETKKLDTTVVLFHWDFFPWDMWLAFPAESQLRQNGATNLRWMC